MPTEDKHRQKAGQIFVAAAQIKDARDSAIFLEMGEEEIE